MHKNNDLVVEGRAASLTQSARESNRSQRMGSRKGKLKNAKVGDSDYDDSMEYEDHGGDYEDADDKSIQSRLNRI